MNYNWCFVLPSPSRIGMLGNFKNLIQGDSSFEKACPAVRPDGEVAPLGVGGIELKNYLDFDFLFYIIYNLYFSN